MYKNILNKFRFFTLGSRKDLLLYIFSTDISRGHELVQHLIMTNGTKM